MSVALLLHNSKRKKSNFRSPAHDLLWANLRVQLHLPPIDLAMEPWFIIPVISDILYGYILWGTEDGKKYTGMAC